MDNKKKWYEAKWVHYTIAACSAVLLFVILNNLGTEWAAVKKFIGFFSPVLFGAIIAYIVDPLAVFFEKRLFGKMKKEKLRRVLAVILAILIVVLFLVFILVLLIPQLVLSLSTFIKNFNGYMDKAVDLVQKLNVKLAAYKIDISGIETWAKKFLSGIGEKLPEYLTKILSLTTGVGGSLVNVAMGVILADYFLLDKARIVGGMKHLFKLIIKPANYVSIGAFLDKCHSIMVRYIVCELLEALIVGGVNMIFMLIMRMPYAMLVSVIVGVTNMIPTFGPIIGGAIGGFILLLDNPLKALWFIIFTIVLQAVDGYILKPKMYGDTLGVPSVLVLVFILVGGKMFGIIGILLAIPAAAIISYCYENLTIPWLEKRKAKKQKAAVSKESAPEGESE